MFEIWPKQNKICFQKKFESVIILPLNISSGGIGGCGNWGGDDNGGGNGASGGGAVGMVVN